MLPRIAHVAPPSLNSPHARPPPTPPLPGPNPPPPRPPLTHPCAGPTPPPTLPPEPTSPPPRLLQIAPYPLHPARVWPEDHAAPSTSTSPPSPYPVATAGARPRGRRSGYPRKA